MIQPLLLAVLASAAPTAAGSACPAPQTWFGARVPASSSNRTKTACHLRWSVTNGTSISIEVTASAPGFVAFAVSQDGKMNGNVAIVGAAASSDGISTVRGYELQDWKAYETDSLHGVVHSAVSQSSETGSLTLAFTRPLRWHHDAIDGAGGFTGVMCSYGSDIPIGPHTVWGTHRINALTGEQETGAQTGLTPRIPLLTVHAAGMMWAWLLGGPAAIAVIRYYRHRKSWLFWHQLLGQGTMAGSSSALFTLVSSPMPFADKMQSPHAVAGLLMVGLACVQWGLGLLSAFGLKRHAESLWHARIRWCHRWLGRLLVLAGLAQCWFGFELLMSAAAAAACKGLIVAILALLAAMEIRACARRRVSDGADTVRHALHEKCARLSLPAYTSAEIHDKVASGMRWIVVADAVVDIDEWLDVHPGGASVLLKHVGTDVTRAMTGEDGGHRHSSAAFRLLQARVRGTAVREKEEEERENSGRNSSAVGGGGGGGGGSGGSLASRHRIVTATVARRVILSGRGSGGGGGGGGSAGSGSFLSGGIGSTIGIGGGGGSAAAPVELFEIEARGLGEDFSCGQHYLFHAHDRNGFIVTRRYTPIRGLLCEDDDDNGRLSNDEGVGRGGGGGGGGGGGEMAGQSSRRQRQRLQFAIRLYSSGTMSRILTAVLPTAVTGSNTATGASTGTASNGGDNNTTAGCCRARRGASAARGHKIRISGPFLPATHERLAEVARPGAFTHVAWVVGGTGITPALQVLSTLLEAPGGADGGGAANVFEETRMDVVWQCRSADETFAGVLLDRVLEHAKGGVRLSYHLTGSRRPLSQQAPPPIAQRLMSRRWSVSGGGSGSNAMSYVTGRDKQVVAPSSAATAVAPTISVLPLPDDGGRDGKEAAAEEDAEAEVPVSAAEYAAARPGASAPGQPASQPRQMATSEWAAVWQGRITARRLKGAQTSGQGACQGVLAPLVEAAHRGEPTLVVLSGPPGFCTAMGQMLTRDVGVPSAAVCRLD